MRPLKNAQFCSNSRKAIRLRRINHRNICNISRIALKLHCVPKFEPDAEIGQISTDFERECFSKVSKS